MLVLSSHEGVIPPATSLLMFVCLFVFSFQFSSSYQGSLPIKWRKHLCLVRGHSQALLWLVKSFLTPSHLANQVFNLHHEGGGVYPLCNVSLFLHKCFCAGSSKLPSSFLFYFLLLQNYSDCSKPRPSPRMLTGGLTYKHIKRETCV